MFGKKKESKVKGKHKNTGYIFVVEKDGFAYYRDKRLNLVCKKAKLCANSPYDGYMWKYDYLANLDWFKRYCALMKVNSGNIKYVGMTEDEFYALGGKELDIDSIEEVQIKK